jgi:hypothetical protein|tara:strand:+ start:5407 stop:5562 length:156 start_codon:yes stop_codon:yes gene_type:complete
MKPRTPDVNKELLQKATGSLYLITDPQADVYIQEARARKKHKDNYLEYWNT